MTMDTDDPFGISGTIIAEKYRIETVIGEGGFSIVYKAEHTIWRQPVAIKCFKILANAPVDQRDRLLDDFIQEGKLMAKLSSRSAAIVQARDVGTFTARDGAWIPYMVLEWLEGRPLDAVLYDERMAGMPSRQIHEVLALLEPAAIAFEIAHANSIAHRDIKPENLFIIGDPRGTDFFVKVLDFGIAKVMGDHAALASALAQTSAVAPTAFTPSHGAPEQFSRSHGATGPWTDVFAMALVMVEVMLGGGAALQGDDYMQLAVASRDPARRPTPRMFGLEVSTAVEAVFAKALAVSPADRFTSMGKFWAALHQAVFPDSSMWNPGSMSGISLITANTSSGFSASGRISSPGGTQPPLNPTPPGTVQSPGADPRYYAQVTTQPSQGGPSKPAIFFSVVGLAALAGGGLAAYMFFVRGQGTEGGDTPTIGAGSPTGAVSGAAPASASVAAVPARRTECPSDMVLVSGGRFFMGSDDEAFKLWQPAHKVSLDTFCIDTYEVTVEAYKACSDAGDCKRPDAVPNYPKAAGPKEISDEQHEKIRNIYAEFCNFGKDGREKHPINCVSWELSDAFCKVKGKRLPTEAEWEYAARGSDGRKFPWGDEPGGPLYMNAAGIEFNKWEASKGQPTSGRMYEADDGHVGTAPVGSFPKGKTKFGAYDIVGNVWEWTADWFQTYKPDEEVNPKGAPAGERKVIRGGAFNGGVQIWLNPAFRYHQVATASSHGIGFRCALTL
jgi:formylglycine-generating enzyme required for sulfatase activity/serine/threonine protein kinase